jgi:hypothetical protein
MAERTGFWFATCGIFHEELPMCYGVPAPDYWEMLSEEERGKRGEITTDLCVIDQSDFFVRGNLEIPVQNSEEVFIYTVWVSLSEKNFARTLELWNSSDREQEPPYFGWLSTSLPGYPPTLNLKTMVHTRAVGTVPFIELEPTDHPLAIEQRQGISRERIQEIAEYACTS